MGSKTTVCTAIPYVNSTPHIGNILTTLSGDITARYLRMRGHDVWFQVGTDENGLKIKEAAEKAGEEPMAFVARIAKRFEDIFAAMAIAPDDFVRTTSDRHKAATQAMFSKLLAAGYIYEGSYEGWYDVSTETFYKEEELVGGKSPDGNEVRWVSEKNYFFKLSAFEQQLLDAYETGRLTVVPATRQNEVVSFIKQGLRDACISRANPGWGVEVPGDPSRVIYVWFDAVINYITTTGYPAEGWEQAWPPVVQWIGKDILTRFHATLWPAMLWGCGFEAAPVIAAHAWILLGSGEKISKSKGNVIEPLVLRDELAARAGIAPEVAVDAIRYLLSAGMGYENDTTFTHEDFDRRFNSDLANDLGNALNRSLSMAHKFCGGVVPDAPVEAEIVSAVQEAKAAYASAMDGYRLEQAASAALGLIRFLNKYVDTRAPWALAKSADPALNSVLRSMLFAVRTAEGLVRPYMPVAADSIAAQLGSSPLNAWDEIGAEKSLPAGTALGQPVPIFPRLEIAKAPVSPSPSAKERGPGGEVSGAGKKNVVSAPEIIEFPDFMKVKLRVGRIVEAEEVSGSEKLLKLQVSLGDEQRQILAGIKKSYAPIDLIGRQVIVVANLKPAKLMGHESQGMLLAADDADGSAILLQPDAEAPDGTSVH